MSGRIWAKMTVPAISQYAAILFALAAAASWFRSATIRLPPTGQEPWKGTGPFHAALVKQSRWNAVAAICAALAAIFQVISLAAAN